MSLGGGGEVLSTVLVEQWVALRGEPWKQSLALPPALMSPKMELGVAGAVQGVASSDLAPVQSLHWVHDCLLLLPIKGTLHLSFQVLARTWL